MSQDLEQLGLQKIAIDVQAKLAPICEYLFKHYNIEVQTITVNRWHPQLPDKIACPQGYVKFTTKKGDT